jgi:uncharacterized damage-inducible protein DinB
MSLSATLLPEFDNETATTRRVLERLPERGLGWQPHARSMTMGRLASHIAELLAWIATTLSSESLDFAPPGGAPWTPASFDTRQEILDLFDRNRAEARRALEAATDEEMKVSWSLLKGGHTIFTLPRVAALRGMVFNHIVHHRGQLSVYLRLNDIPVPSIYGPTADEGN